MVLLHPATGTGSISDTPTGPCYPTTDVCVTIGHAIAGCRHGPAGDGLGARVGASMIGVFGTPVACRAWRGSFAGTKGKVGI